MIEFISLLVSYVFMAIADSIDSAFGNNISIDAVIVVGCMGTIGQVTRAFSRIGSYYYRVERKDEFKCLQMDLIAGSICGIILFLLRDRIIDIYNISSEQKEILRDVLNWYCIYIPCYAIGNTSFELVRLLNKLKTYRKGLIYFYVLLIGTDAIVYYCFKSLPLMYAATILSQLLAAGYFYIKMKWKFQVIDLKFIKESLKYGIPTAFERFACGITVMVYGALASRIGNAEYAIHSVCYGAAVTGESVTNAYDAALMIKLPINKSYKESRDTMLLWAKKMLFILMFTYITYSIVSLFIYHGKVSIGECFPWYIFYIFEIVGLYIYENSKVLCINQKYVSILPFGVIVGFAFRFIMCVIGLHTTVPLIFFGLGSSFDWAFRGLLYYFTLKHNKLKDNSN